MANYKKYAENLIGNWEKDIYEPQKDVTKAIYQTNWDKLTNDYNTVRDKLDRNFNLARMDYSNSLNDVQNASFNRMNNANIDLANRGLTSSGIGNLITQTDTQMKGENVDKALAELLDANNANIEGLTESVIGLGKGQTSLAGDLSDDIGKLTDADAANMQQYGGLLGSIGEGAAQRAASRAGSGKSKKAKKLEEEANDLERKMLIADTITNTEMTDEQKAFYLNTYLDVPAQTAIDVVSNYNNNNLLKQRASVLGNLTNYVNEKGLNPDYYTLENIKAMNDRYKTLSDEDLAKMVQDYKYNGAEPMNRIDALILQKYNDDLWGNGLFKKAKAQTKVDAINRLNDKLGDYTYTDLYEMLYGKR